MDREHLSFFTFCFNLMTEAVPAPEMLYAFDWKKDNGKSHFPKEPL
jgi:hypothetical protein